MYTVHVYAIKVLLYSSLAAHEVLGKFILMTPRPLGEDVRYINMPRAVCLIHVGLAQARRNNSWLNGNVQTRSKSINMTQNP